jgi:hypothetical protein
VLSEADGALFRGGEGVSQGGNGRQRLALRQTARYRRPLRDGLHVSRQDIVVISFALRRVSARSRAGQ